MSDFKQVKENTKKLTLLYVEDDPIMRKVSSELFENYFAQVDTAFDGLEGLEKYTDFYKKNGSYYDLIITDISMPNLDGLSMSKEIFKLNNLQSIIISSAHNDMDSLLDAINLGVNSFLLKPLDVKILNRILLKVSQTIIDKKIVESYVDTIEELNFELQRKIEQLEKSQRQLNCIADKEIQRSKEQHTIEDSEVHFSQDDIDNFNFQMEQIQNNELDDLIDLLDQMDRIVLEMARDIENCNIYVNELGVKLQNYGSRISFYTIFNKLSVKISDFAQFIFSKEITTNSEGREYLIALLESFIFMLNKWQNNIVHADIQSVNYFDDSIIGDIDTIMLSWVESEDDEDFEDDIFF